MIYPVFHVSLVKSYHEPLQDFPLRAVPFPPVVNPDGEQLFEVEAVLDKRTRHNPNPNPKNFSIFGSMARVFLRLQSLDSFYSIFSVYHSFMDI